MTSCLWCGEVWHGRSARRQEGVGAIWACHVAFHGADDAKASPFRLVADLGFTPVAVSDAVMPIVVLAEYVRENSDA